MTTLDKRGEILTLDDDKLRDWAVAGRVGPDLTELARIELGFRINMKNLEATKRMVELTDKNLQSTKEMVEFTGKSLWANIWLAVATWGLVISTAILAIITFLK